MKDYIHSPATSGTLFFTPCFTGFVGEVLNKCRKTRGKKQPEGNTSLHPAQEYCPTEGRTSACWKMPWNSVYAASPSSPIEYKTQQAHELLSLCSGLYNLQQPLHTLLISVSVPRTDPAPSQGQGPLIMHCELVQTGWTQKQNNLPLGQWSDALKME